MEILERVKTCMQCGHTWLALTQAGPRKCPVCQSAKWAEPKKKGEHTLVVPVCEVGQTEGWEIIHPITQMGYRCARCEHEWVPKVQEPRVCPKCKSAYWNRPRKSTQRF